MTVSNPRLLANAIKLRGDLIVDLMQPIPRFNLLPWEASAMAAWHI
jgi:hypothetical protein